MKIKNLTVCYEQLAILEDFSLELPDQGIICFFAPSGTGKTTLLRVLCGLIPAQIGTIEGLEEKKFAFVFQEDRLIPSLSVRDNVGLVLGKEYQALAQEYLGALGLSGWEESCAGLRLPAPLPMANSMREMSFICWMNLLKDWMKRQPSR